MDRDLDTNQEMRDAGVLNVVSGALGGIPGYHALSLTALAERMRVDARAAGLIAALVPLAAVVFGGSVVGLIPKMIVGGVLVFLGLSFIVEWVWDKRRLLPPREYAVVVVILLGIIVWGFLTGVVIGLVLAVMLFVISYGRIELVREVAFGETYRSNVDRPADERAELRGLSDRVQILRVSGFVFFGSTNRLLERIRASDRRHPAPLPGDRPAARDGRGFLGGRLVREGDAPGGGLWLRGDLHRSLRSGARAARAGRRGREGWARLLRARPGPRAPAVRGRAALRPRPGRGRGGAPRRRSPDGLPPGLAAHLERVSCSRARSCSTRTNHRATSTCSSPGA